MALVESSWDRPLRWQLRRAQRREVRLRRRDPEAACTFTGSRKCQPAMTLRWRSCFGTCVPRADMSETDLAAQLATRPEVVQALEQGALYALPPWPETYRVVSTYGTLAQSRCAAASCGASIPARRRHRRAGAETDAGRSLHGAAGKRRARIPRPGATSRASGRRVLSSCSAAAVSAAAKGAAIRARPASAAETSTVSAVSAKCGPSLNLKRSRRRGNRSLNLRRSKEARHPRHRARHRLSLRRCRAPASLHRRARGKRRQGHSCLKLRPRSPRGGRLFRLRTRQPRSPGRGRRSLNGAWWRWSFSASPLALWMWLAKPTLLGSGKAPGQPGAKSTNQGAPTDPNDPRSRKADRLPGPS